ncbi:MAG: lysophospholipid transporter LplT [Brachymonas sp.]|nr:lysophospholipid transporter LplT [Brachymonas sp.]
MKRGFYSIMAAQSFSALADNALFIAAVALMRYGHEPEWKKAALIPIFAVFYVLLAPFVGAFSDAHPKGRVMFISNAIKAVGCLMMLMGVNPLAAYAVVGLGAAAYSPAKYGILTELLPSSQLVKANGWIEGLTIASIILGTVLGGQLIHPNLFEHVLKFNFHPRMLGHLTSPPLLAIALIMNVYLIAAVINMRIPHTGVAMIPMPKNIFSLVPDFWRCNARLWKDKLGQITLAVTTLFWGVSGNLRYLVLAWAAAALGYGEGQAAKLVGVVAVGTAVGAIWASMRVKLDRATNVMPLGFLMGLVVLVLLVVKSAATAMPIFILLGALGGYMVVPMNALLQHRGHNLMGAGRSIAVQNFNEQASTLALGFFYTFMTGRGLSSYGSVVFFGVLVAGCMALIMLWHARNVRKHPAELERLLAEARAESPHGH